MKFIQQQNCVIKQKERGNFTLNKNNDSNNKVTLIVVD